MKKVQQGAGYHEVVGEIFPFLAQEKGASMSSAERIDDVSDDAAASEILNVSRGEYFSVISSAQGRAKADK